jgi:transmembrane 9 superfamily protein 3
LCAVLEGKHPCSQVYYVYGFMLLVFLILMIVTVCVTIVGTYFLLNAENYHWQWTSYCAAASTALCAPALLFSS